MTDDNVSSNLASAWEYQRIWSLTANKLRKEITRLRGVILILAIAGAVLVTVGAQVSDAFQARRILSGLGAAALAAAPVISRTKLGKDEVSDWIRARSASEGLKSEVYLYRAGADPYGDDDRDAALAARYNEILDNVNDISLHAADVKPDTKGLPPEMDPEAYIELRVNAQADGYYLKTAARLKGNLKQLRTLEFVLGAVAALLALAATLPLDWFATGAAAWVAVATTAGAALAAQIAANRYEHLITTYRATARQLKSIRDDWLDRDPANRMSASDFIHASENAVSVENQGWMAKWTERPESAEAEGS